MPSLRSVLGDRVFGELVTMFEAAKRKAYDEGYAAGRKAGRPMISDETVAALKGMIRSRTVGFGALLAAAAGALADPDLQAWVQQYLGQYSYTVLLGAASAATIVLRHVTTISLAAKAAAPKPDQPAQEP